MTSDSEQRRHGDSDSSTTSVTAAEDTPLLRSETSSTVTARDGSPSSQRRPSDSPEQPLGRRRAACIVLSMWALIFLQGNFTWAENTHDAGTDLVQPAT